MNAKKYDSYKDIIAESALLSFSDYEYDNKVSSFNITIGESYAVKAKKDRQSGKYEFELTDKYGNVEAYSEKKFISTFPEAYVKFKDELHTSAAKEDPELKNLDKKIIKEEADEEVDKNVEFMFKRVNPDGTDITSLVETDFIISDKLDKTLKNPKLFHILLSVMPDKKNDPFLLIKARDFDIDDNYVLGSGNIDGLKFANEYNMSSFKAKYPNLLKMLFNAMTCNGYLSYLSKYNNELADDFPVCKVQYIDNDSLDIVREKEEQL